MKTKLLLLPMLAFAIAFAGNEKANALDIGLGIGVGGRHHNGGSFSFSTSDPTYTTYYPSMCTPNRPTTRTLIALPIMTAGMAMIIIAATTGAKLVTFSL